MMNRVTKGWSVAALITVTSLAVLLGVQRKSARLQVELDAARQVRAQLEATERRARAKKEEADLELGRLRASEVEWLRLQQEIEALKSAKMESRPPAPTGSEPEKVVGLTKAASEWRNVGRATPAANLETALWAAVGGDVDALAGLITFHDVARAKAEAVLGQMPLETRHKFDSPEKWIAFLTVQDIPTAGHMRIMSEWRANEGESRLGVLFFNDHATPEERKRYDRMRELAFRPDEDGWKLVVPASAIEEYAAMLKGPRTTDH